MPNSIPLKTNGAKAPALPSPSVNLEKGFNVIVHKTRKSRKSSRKLNKRSRKNRK